jgi:hypothetical protein
MRLSSIANPAWETIRGVSFSMLHGPALVTIVVTHAALSEIDDVTPGVGGHLACLQKHRRAFEHVASVKHQRGLLEESGAVMVQVGDRTAFKL